MSRQLAAAVHISKDGQVHSFLPGDTVPGWASKLITNPAAWLDNPSSSDEGAGAGSIKPQASGAPPRSGKGSTVAAWRKYADDNGFDVDEDATREDIITTLAQNGVAVN